MARYFNNKEIELLAPAGNFEIFKQIVDLGCDAVYFGGKKLHMRVQRRDYIFSDEDLREAVAIGHEKGKKIYITVNNLHDSKDLNELVEYLHFLDEIKPDALIIQDLSVTEYIKNLNLSLPLHASVMMDAHNFETVKTLKNLGIARVIMSRECNLADIKAMSYQTDIEFEYFMHGDMCGAHGGHCYYSTMLFGSSSNRGHCRKPCRWAYKIKQGNKLYESEYPIAVKDMCMYEFIPELIHNNITSFKIEGRMRDAEYLKLIVTLYADAIDRYIQDPLSYDRKKDSDIMFEHRKRDMSTLFAFRNPGISHINTRFEGTGALYSTGKMFSDATDERSITAENIEKMKSVLAPLAALNPLDSPSSTIPSIGVHVNSIETAYRCIDLGVDRIYLSEPFCSQKPVTKEQVKELSRSKKNSQFFLSLPFPMYDDNFSEYEHLLADLASDFTIDGLLCTTIGAVSRFNELGYKLSGDYNLNIYNEEAAHAYFALGLSDYTISIESPAAQVAEILSKTGQNAELVCWGAPTVMIFEHDLHKNTEVFPSNPVYNNTNKNIIPPFMYFVDGKGNEHPIYKTTKGKYNMLTYRHICLLPVLNELRRCGLRNLRLECLDMPENMTENVVRIYRKALDTGDTVAAYENLRKFYPDTTFGAYEFT